MITEEHVYIAYRKAKSLQSGKGYRLPKDWQDYFDNRMSKTNQDRLTLTAGFFNTKWSNIDLNTYMERGCELFKTFSYHQFQHPKVLQHYIEQDKQRKRKMSINIDMIDKSFDYISKYMNGKTSPDYTILQLYCKIRNNQLKQVISDYLSNKIDSIVLTYCLYYKYLKLTDIEREYCYNISNRYREFLELMFEVEDYIKSKERK